MRTAGHRHLAMALILASAVLAVYVHGSQDTEELDGLADGDSLRKRAVTGGIWETLSYLASFFSVGAQELRQYYVAFEHEEAMLQAVHGLDVRLGPRLDHQTHMVIASERTARRLLASSLQRLKVSVRQLADGRTDYHIIDSLVVVLVEGDAGRTSTSDSFQHECHRFFSESILQQARSPHIAPLTQQAADQRLHEPTTSRRGVAGADPLARVVDWLCDRWQVLWVEPKMTFKPSTGFATKIVSYPLFSGTISRQSEADALTSPVMTASFSVTSFSGSRTGQFNLHASGASALGGNGTNTNMLIVLRGAVMEPVVSYMLNNRNYTSSFVLDAPGRSIVPNVYVGMLIELTDESPLDTSFSCIRSTDRTLGSNPRCPRVVSHFDPLTGRVEVHPAWLLLSTKSINQVPFRIRPMAQAGDLVTVRADAESIRVEILPDSLTFLYKTKTDPGQMMVVECRRSSGSGGQGEITALALPQLYMDEGYSTIKARCMMDVNETVVKQIPAQLLPSCGQVCSSNLSIASFLADGHFSSSVAALDAAAAPSNGYCTCVLNVVTSLVINFTLPEANPVWDRGLDGSGQIIGLTDTGLDVTNCLLSEGNPSDPSNLTLAPSTGAVDLKRRKVVGYSKLLPDDCALCDGCPKLMRWDSYNFYGDFSKLPVGFVWTRAYPHRCPDSTYDPALSSCCGFTSVPTGSSHSDPCSSCTCPDINDLSNCCLEALNECKVCCHACGADASLWPRRYDRYGAQVQFGLSAPAQILVLVLVRDKYNELVVSQATDVSPFFPFCLNPNCDKPVYSLQQTFQLPPSRNGYGVVIVNKQGMNLQLTGELDGGAGFQFFTARHPCGDAADDDNGHGSFCGSVAAGSVDPATGNEAEKRMARLHEGMARGAKLHVFDVSSGSTGGNNFTVPLDLYDGMLKPLWDQGVRISSNSWSCYFPRVVCSSTSCSYSTSSYCNKYSTAAMDIDRFVYDHQEMLVLVPAGDARSFTGPASSSSLQSPATCKNCIAVGSSHNWNALLRPATSYMDPLDSMSAPLSQQRLMCPRSSWPDKSLWPSDPNAPAVSTNSTVPDPVFPVPMDCCNSDPKRIAQVLSDISYYSSKGLTDLLQQQQQKLFPCIPQTTCCLSNAFKSPELSFCCPSSFPFPDKLGASSYDIDKVVGSSARGPAGDGLGTRRMKPDLVAPGAFLVAANGRKVTSSSPQSLPRHCKMNSRRDQPFNEEDALVAMSGTSVSTAMVAGMAAILRQYFMEGWYPLGDKGTGKSLQPSAALLKAMLIASSSPLNSLGSSSSDLCNSVSSSGLLLATCLPNPDEGWGLPSLPRALFFKDRGSSMRLWVEDERVGLHETGSVHEYQFQINMTEDGTRLSVALVWTDPPPPPADAATAAAGGGAGISLLVNDLDLNVSDASSISFVNGLVCPIDPMTDLYRTDCPRPIPDRANPLEATTFPVKHRLQCNYARGSALEYGKCSKEDSYGLLLSSSIDRSPVTVTIRLTANRIVNPCVSDGYNQVCSSRPQPYALVVMGPLARRPSDDSLLPPVFKAYKVEIVGNSSNVTMTMSSSPQRLVPSWFALSSVVTLVMMVGGGGWY
ncbi:hypothetical protein GUITHDRAFT_146719 [Guillardia theta CCMP2712]|uniref:Peptidase S8/S53 domain-containing protein n=1 Tax=Guillardia theta (strain CCMP2712) TaxID=905079 RepID=L1IH28_GUITC|nr:hypothetical protein GUITHDRAFT_146719 [Guillardia theta CCMP2712]EKX35135.1 hypothetical protein GUITHDRAFT_146719 [Guillardia theta CCMP2712]|eukprot:XP_005822115.1 hypothetical protein GUITHDRAFT_146719 [Guillardia theta CCMP2712]